MSADFPTEGEIEAYDRGFANAKDYWQPLETERILSILDQKHNPTVGDTTHNQSNNCIACEATAYIQGEK